MEFICSVVGGFLVGHGLLEVFATQRYKDVAVWAVMQRDTTLQVLALVNVVLGLIFFWLANLGE